MPPLRLPARRSRLKTWFQPWWLAGLGVLLLGAVQPRLAERIDLLGFDLLVPALQQAPQSVVLRIDDTSLAALGRWPWPRELHARMLDRLHEAGATQVVLDILFAEAADAQGDTALAAALQRRPGTVLAAAPATPTATTVDDVVLPQPALQVHGRIGHVQVPIDADDHVRRLALKAGPGAPLWPALALAALPPPEAAELTDADAALSLTPHTWTTTPPVLLPRAGEGQAALPEISFVQALADPALAQKVRGRTVFVGVTASGLDQPLQTSLWPHDRPISAVQFHAHAFEALRQGAHITPWSVPAQWSASLALVVAALLLWCRNVPSLRCALTVAATLTLPWVMSGVLLTQQQWFAPALPTLALLTAAVTRMGQRHWRTHRDGQRARRKAQATLQAIGDAVIVMRSDGGIDHLNPSAERLARQAVPAGAGLGEVFAFDAHSLMRLQQTLQQALSITPPATRSQPLPEPVRIHTPAGLRALRATFSPMQDRRGRPDGVVLALSDVTEELAATARLAYTASHDALTQLSNRTVLSDRLATALAQAPDRLAALLFIDLDRFKRINDSLGHHHGDEVLRVTAARLRATCRPGDTVARWGGDEFVVLMPGLATQSEAATAARAIVAALSQDIDLDGLQVASSCSVGIALAPEHGVDLETLIALADSAMYAAKAQPALRWQFYQAATGPWALWTRDRLSLEADIRSALEQGHFELHLQPQVATLTGRLVGFEALLRWRHESGRLIMPDEFIGVAEESGLILTLGHWALREAVQLIARWQQRGGPQVPVAVNISVLQCMDRSLVQTLGELLAQSRIPPHLLTLEVTETAAMKDAAQVHDLLSAIHALGVNLSLDDFGTGYSSLAYLKRFPIDEIKIDRSFVRDIDIDPDSTAIVRATIAMAHSLGLQVVAEGVETEAQRRRLQQLHCDRLQGYLFSPALPVHEAATWQESLRLQATPADEQHLDARMLSL